MSVWREMDGWKVRKSKKGRERERDWKEEGRKQ